jgi:3'-5' exoribonuclease
MIQAQHPQKGPWISELKDGQEFIGFYRIHNISLETFRDITRGRYLRLSLSDRSGAMEARIWEDAEKVAATLDGHIIAKVDGKAERFRDRLQIRIQRIRPADPGEYDLADMRPSTARDVALMMTRVEDALAGIKNPHLSRLAHHFFDQEGFRKAFQEAPAGVRIHHAYLGGLLEHTYEILELAPSLLALYPEIDRDLLMTGILLHDIGKLEEYQWDLDIGFTDQGRLLGHVILGTQRLSRAMTLQSDFPQDLAFELQHMILAHHGRYEYGSPRRPKTMEAIALHHLEYLDAQVNRFKSLIEEARKQGRNWTSYDNMLDRSLYVGHEVEISIEELGFAD